MSSRRSEGAVELPVTVRAAMLAHARVEAPNECCGLLVGDERRVHRAVAARNVLASPTRYRVHPEDHFAALRAARASGTAIVGAYHSHPHSPAEPSATDLAEASYPEFVYVIVSPAAGLDGDGDVRAYRLDPSGRAFRAVELIGVDG